MANLKATDLEKTLLMRCIASPRMFGNHVHGVWFPATFVPSLEECKSTVLGGQQMLKSSTRFSFSLLYKVIYNVIDAGLFRNSEFHGSGPIIRRFIEPKDQNSGVKLGKGTGRAGVRHRTVYGHLAPEGGGGLNYERSLKDQDIAFDIKWTVLRKAAAYRNTTRRCNLCIAEKLEIMKADKDRSLNRRSELVSKCQDENQFYLCHSPPPPPRDSMTVAFPSVSRFWFHRCLLSSGASLRSPILISTFLIGYLPLVPLLILKFLFFFQVLFYF